MLADEESDHYWFCARFLLHHQNEKTPPSLASMIVQMRFELAGETATPMMPSVPLGRPLLLEILVHVSPPVCNFFQRAETISPTRKTIRSSTNTPGTCKTEYVDYWDP